MTSINNNENGKTAEIQRVIELKLGVAAQFDPHYDRLRIRMDDRVQSRIDKNTAPKFMVERYAAQMSVFTFPPVVITSDGILVDGNTRTKAAAQRNDRYLPVLIVPIAWDTADAETRGRRPRWWALSGRVPQPPGARKNEPAPSLVTRSWPES
jgi:hypothetical protein